MSRSNASVTLDTNQAAALQTAITAMENASQILQTSINQALTTRTNSNIQADKTFHSALASAGGTLPQTTASTNARLVPPTG